MIIENQLFTMYFSQNFSQFSLIPQTLVSYQQNLIWFYFSFFYLQVYIVGHIPPGSDERHIGLQQNGHTTFTESNNKRYLELVRKYSSIIQGQFFGHLHSDSFRIIYDDKGE